MTTDRDFDRLARAWLELGPDEAPDRVVAAVLQAADTMPQVRRRVAWPTWRPLQMNRLLLLAGTAVLLVALIGGGAFIVGSRAPSVALPSQDAGASTAPAASTTPVPSATAIPSASASASGALRVPGIDVDLRTVTPLAKIDVGIFPFGTPGGGRVASDGTTLWLGKSAEIVGIDPSSSTVRTRISLGGDSGAYSAPIAVSPGAIWMDGPGADPNSITRWDSKTGKQVASVPVASPFSPLFADGSIWAGEASSGSVVRIDPATNKVVATIATGSAGDTGVVAGDGSIWVGNSTTGDFARIDPKSNKIVGTIHPAGDVGDLTFTRGAFWSGISDDPSSVARFDAATGATSWNTSLDGGITNLIVRPDAIWVGFLAHTASTNGVIVAIDPASGKVVDALSIPGGQVQALFEGFGSVWAVLGQAGLVERFSPDVLTVKH